MSSSTLPTHRRATSRHPLAIGAVLVLALPTAGVAGVPRAQPLAAADATAARTGSPERPAADAVASRPFTPGEKLSYEVRFGALKVGTGRMEVRPLVRVRGRLAYHTVFTVRGGTPFYRVHDVFESWFAADDLSSLRFHKQQDEGPKQRDSRYEIFPERGTYDWKSDDEPEQRSVANPLDDGSFIYFLRTVPLEAGRTYHFNRYFKPDRNPVTIRVLRRERVKVPAGTFDAVVVQPVIKTKGIFSENGHAEVWLSDDSRRMMLQLKSKLKFGSLNLYLTAHAPGAPIPVLAGK